MRNRLRAGRINPRRLGQGMVEYAGALLIAAMIIATLATAAKTNNWMYNSYYAIFTAAGNMLMNAAGNI